MLGDFDSVTALEFNETANDGSCNPNETGTNCEDFYLSALTDFAPEMFNFDGMQFQVLFRVIPVQNAIVDIIGDQLRVITREDAPGTSIIDVQMLWRKVPAPATLALLGLGLAGIGAFSRRKQKKA